MPDPSLTVAVCSAGRPDLVVACVEHTARTQAFAPGDELLVVLNGSGRGAARGRLASSRGRVVEEPALGLSRARNRALAEASGEVVVFIDDDVRVREGWLAAWRAAARDELAVAGGPIVAEWPSGRPPRWYHPRLDPYWSLIDLGPEPSSADAHEPTYRAFGANFGVRRELALEIGGFDLRFGRGGTVADGGEESDLIDRLDQLGHATRWVPDARVGHLVGERARLRWLVRRAYQQGVADRSFGAPAPTRGEPVRSGWRDLAGALRRHPTDAPAALTVDLVRRARLLGRAAPGK